MSDNTAGEGTLVEIDGRRELVFHRTVNAPRADVWDALVDPERAGRWAFAGTFEPRAGGKLRFDHGDGSGADGTVIAYVKGEVLEYEFDFEPGPVCHVRYALADADGGGTALTFHHLLPDPSADFAAGWHWHFDRLDQLLGGVEPAQVVYDDHFVELQARYADALGG